MKGLPCLLCKARKLCLKGDQGDCQLRRHDSDHKQKDQKHEEQGSPDAYAPPKALLPDPFQMLFDVPHQHVQDKGDPGTKDKGPEKAKDV